MNMIFLMFFLCLILFPIFYFLQQTGLCSTLSCSSCIALDQASYRDRSDCVSCDATTTLGLNTATGDCNCPTGEVLMEVDYFGVKLATKQCSACPAGQQVITV